MRSPLVALAVVGLAAPCVAQGLDPAAMGPLDAAATYDRLCPELLLDYNRVAELEAAAASPAQNRTRSLSEVLLSYIPGMGEAEPPLETLPLPEAKPPETYLSRAECAEGLAKFGPQGSVVPGLVRLAS